MSNPPTPATPDDALIAEWAEQARREHQSAVRCADGLGWGVCASYESLIARKACDWQREQFAALHELASQDVVYFGTGGEAFVLCSDTFAYACADGELLPLSESRFVLEIYQKFGSIGAVAWCACRRDSVPLKPYLTPEYYTAYNAIRATTPKPSPAAGVCARANSLPVEAVEAIKEAIQWFESIADCSIAATDPDAQQFAGALNTCFKSNALQKAATLRNLLPKDSDK